MSVRVVRARAFPLADRGQVAIVFGQGSQLKRQLEPWRVRFSAMYHSGLAGLIVSEPRGLGQIDPEPVPSALVAAGHFGGGVAELFLDVAFIDFGAAGEAGAQGMAGIEPYAFALRQVGAQPCLAGAGLDQPGDMLVREPFGRGLQTIAADRHEERAEVDFRVV